MSAVADKAITTIEAIGDTPAGKKVQGRLSPRTVYQQFFSVR